MKVFAILALLGTGLMADKCEINVPGWGGGDTTETPVTE